MGRRHERCPDEEQLRRTLVSASAEPWRDGTGSRPLRLRPGRPSAHCSFTFLQHTGKLVVFGLRRKGGRTLKCFAPAGIVLFCVALSLGPTDAHVFCRNPTTGEQMGPLGPAGSCGNHASASLNTALCLHAGFTELCSNLSVDQDGDGFALSSSSAAAVDCSGLPTDGTNGCDCDDTNVNTYPDAPEVNDGVDNQCSGDQGHGTDDEISGPPTGDPPAWPPQAGCGQYGIIQSFTPDFSTGCVTQVTGTPISASTPPPASGEVVFYLIQALSPNVGSFGTSSDGMERFPDCP